MSVARTQRSRGRVHGGAVGETKIYALDGDTVSVVAGQVGGDQGEEISLSSFLGSHYSTSSCVLRQVDGDCRGCWRETSQTLTSLASPRVSKHKDQLMGSAD